MTGCREGECYNRFGVDWMTARLAGTRDPYLRRRVPRERLLVHWAAAPDRRQLSQAIEAFRAGLAELPTSQAPSGPPARSFAAAEDRARRGEGRCLSRSDTSAKPWSTA